MSARTCRSCDAPIVWAVTTGGRPIPLDAAAVPTGNVVLRGGTARVLSSVTLGEMHGAGLLDGLPLYVSHFATCPNAKAHRQ